MHKLRFIAVRNTYRNAFAKAVLKGKSIKEASEAAQKAVSKEYGLPWAEIIQNLPNLLAFIKTLIDLFKK